MPHTCSLSIPDNPLACFTIDCVAKADARTVRVATLACSRANLTNPHGVRATVADVAVSMDGDERSVSLLCRTRAVGALLTPF